MNYLKVKIKNKKKLVLKFEHKKLIYKLLKFNKFLNSEVKFNIFNENCFLPINSSKIRLTKRCIITNNKKIFNKNFRISRFLFFKYARLSYLYGLQKDSW